MRRIVVAGGAFALVLASVAACEKITHEADFQNGSPVVDDAGVVVGPEATPDDEICRRCGDSGANLRHPPCPTESTAPDDGQYYVYAWRNLKLGLSADPTKTLDPTAYDQGVGYDLDCSDREPTGYPVKCAAIIPEAGADAETTWKPYPLGIDNALAQRFLGPLFLGALKADPTTLPLDKTFSTQLELGKGSILTIVYAWNGTDDDKQVSVRIVSGFGLVDGSNPKWDGTDKWIAATAQSDPAIDSNQVPLVNSKTDHAYVAGGVLVVDFSSIQPLRNHIVNNSADLYVPLYDMHMVAKITKDKLLYEQFFGRWALSDFAASNDQIAAFLAGCDAAKTYALKRALPGLSNSAADILVVDDTSVTNTCNALTVTWAADAWRGSIGAYKAFPSMSSGCP